MTSDVAGARLLSPGSGEGRRLSAHVVKKRASVPSSERAAGPLAHDRQLGRSQSACVPRDLNELGPDWLELRVWLARSLLRYAARNFSKENTVRRDSM
jgi:hypothetical protein